MRPSTPSVEEAATQERPSIHRVRTQRHRRRQTVTIPRVQEQSAVPVEGPAVDGEEVEVTVSCITLLLNSEEKMDSFANAPNNAYVFISRKFYVFIVRLLKEERWKQRATKK